MTQNNKLIFTQRPWLKWLSWWAAVTVHKQGFGMASVTDTSVSTIPCPSWSGTCRRDAACVLNCHFQVAPSSPCPPGHQALLQPALSAWDSPSSGPQSQRMVPSPTGALDTEVQCGPESSCSSPRGHLQLRGQKQLSFC